MRRKLDSEELLLFNSYLQMEGLDERTLLMVIFTGLKLYANKTGCTIPQVVERIAMTKFAEMTARDHEALKMQMISCLEQGEIDDDGDEQQ